MTHVWLVAVEPAVSSPLRDGCGDLRFEDVAEADACERIHRSAGEIDAVVIGPLASEPIRAAQRAQAADPDLAVVILSEPGAHDRMAGAARRAPFLGAAVSCLPTGDGAGLAAHVGDAAAQTPRRRSARQCAGDSPLEELAYLERLLDAAPIAVLALETDGRVLCANRGAQRLLRSSERDLVGERLADLFDAAGEPRLAGLLAAAAREQAGPLRLEPAPGEVLTLQRGGEARAIEVTATGIAERRGRAGIVAILQDATERESARALRQRNAELERRIAELDAANRELDAFSYSVSHDLRAPLRVIDGFSRALESDHAEQLDAGARHALSRVRAGTRRMSALIDDLLDLSRVGRAPLRREFVDLGELARGVAAELARRDPDRQVAVEIAGDLTATGDGRHLTIVLENLLGNAWKFTSKRPEARIEVGREPRGEETPFFVRDNGAGFDMKYAERLFSPFQRLHGAHEFEGTGIGLATVNRIIARHGGRIWAVAAEGAGATFFFTLGGSPVIDRGIAGGAEP